MVDFINLIIDGVYNLLELTNNEAAIQMTTQLATFDFGGISYSFVDIVFNPLIWLVFIGAGLIKTFIPVA